MRRRVFAFEPQCSPQVDHALPIEPQRFNRGAARRGQAEQCQAVFTPGEVLTPVIFSWVKEQNQFAADRIERVCFVVLCVVAALTGQSEVFSNRFTAEVFRDDVVVRVFLRSVRIGADAVFAIALSTLPDQEPQLFRDALFSHAGRA